MAMFTIFSFVILLYIQSSTSASASIDSALRSLSRPVPPLPLRVAVVGSTGRVGRLVVSELMAQNRSTEIVCCVRDLKKAKEVLGELSNNIDPPSQSTLRIVKIDLNRDKDLMRICEDSDKLIWCATGFTDRSSSWDKLIGLFTLKFNKKATIDIASIKRLGQIIGRKKAKGEDEIHPGPQIVMCSSAGVTRPGWPEEKKTKYVGAADIPIVRLNPFNILGVKLEGEDSLRASGASYCVVRPCGLNDEWPDGRALLTQGDLAVGRINRRDVASLLVSIMSEPSAIEKTFESIALPGFPKPFSYEQQLGKLMHDGDTLSEAALDATYAILQQCTPGAMIAPQKLAMGQTYEQLDRGEQGRLGGRGQEDVPIVAK